VHTWLNLNSSGKIFREGHDDFAALECSPTQSAPISEGGQVSIDGGRSFTGDFADLFQR